MNVALRTLVLLLSLAMVACAGTRPSVRAQDAELDRPAEIHTVPVDPGSTVNVEKLPPSEVYGPTNPPDRAPDPVAEPAPVAVPERKVQKEPKLCLVLGPGMARAWAHAGVIDVLRRNNLPIHCVVGVELGGVVGAFYAMNASVNTMQWHLFKINEDNLLNFPMLSLGAKRSSGKKFHAFLEGIFSNRKIETLKVKFATIGTRANGSPQVFLSGEVAEALSASVALPSVFDGWRLKSGEEMVGGGISLPAPVDVARGMGGSLVVLVDVLRNGNGPDSRRSFIDDAFQAVEQKMDAQRSGADFTLKVTLRDVAYDNFSNQGAAVAAGRDAAEAEVDEIRKAWDERVEHWKKCVAEGSECP